MSLSTRMIVVLTAVGLLSGSFLAIVGQVTKERIIFNKRHEIEMAALKVVPGASSVKMIYEERDFAVFEDRDEAGNLLGYALKAAGTGFQDKIVLEVGVNAELTTVLSLTVIEQKETPGLGAKITSEEDFLRYWQNRDCTKELTLRKPPVEDPGALASNEVNAITGATISSRAILNIVNEAIKKARQLRTEGKLSGIN
ncbi:MAG: FMN-binding protein [candidate division WOR-3 bacterium]|nr:FMN-binding protein [candidate division WOR-3 bacterium]